MSKPIDLPKFPLNKQNGDPVSAMAIIRLLGFPCFFHILTWSVGSHSVSPSLKNLTGGSTGKLRYFREIATVLGNLHSPSVRRPNQDGIIYSSRARGGSSIIWGLAVRNNLGLIFA